MPVLFAKIAGGWVPIGGPSGSGSDEVHVGTEPPTGTEELWFDTDAPGSSTDDLRWNSAWGVVAKTKGVTSTWTNATATLTDITVTAGQAPSITTTLYAGRRYRATWQCPVSSTVPADVFVPYVNRDGVASENGATPCVAGSISTTTYFEDRVTTGVVTWKMQGRRSTASTGTISLTPAGAPMYFVIEDIGPWTSDPAAYIYTPVPTQTFHTGWVFDTGWAVDVGSNPVLGYRMGNVVQLRVTFSRTGAPITPTAGIGDITNTNVCVAPPELRGTINAFMTLSAGASGRVVSGGFNPSTGQIQVFAIAGDTAIATGAIISLGGTVIVA